MQDNQGQTDLLSPEIHEVLRNFVSAVRAVKLYPANNPIYSQSVKKSFESLAQILTYEPEYHIGVQKTFFTYERIPVGKDAQINRTITQDLFVKGIREIAFISGITEQELMDLYQTLALPSEEMAMRSGISSILWEKGSTHIKVTEAGLDEVITTKTDTGLDTDTVSGAKADGDKAARDRNETTAHTRTLVLGDLLTDPEGYGTAMVELARNTVGENETVEDRLFSLYREAGKKIEEGPEEEREALFEGLAKSVLSLDAPLRNSMIAGNLYAELDADTVAEQGPDVLDELPGELHEIVTGRYSREWNIKQVATLIKRSSKKKAALPRPPVKPEDMLVVPIRPDLDAVAQKLVEYTAQEMEDLRTISESGMESDIIEAAVRTLIFLMTLVKDQTLRKSLDNEVRLFSGVVHQLEEMLAYLLKKKEYDLASIIIHALHMPVAAEFKPRLAEAIRKTASQTIISSMITELRSAAKGSSEYQAAYAYLSMMEREATEVMLELLAEEQDRKVRLFLVELLRTLGKNHVGLIAEQLNDGRWYVVRNTVRILSESKSEQAVSFLHKVSEHKNLQVRQEVARGLIMIGGKKASTLLSRYLKDKNTDMQLVAIRGLAEISGAGATEARELVNFLQDRRLTKKDNELTIDAITVIGKLGDQESTEFLKRYTKLRWWKSRKLQTGLRTAALAATEEIQRRKGHADRTAS
jgi:HEAT repeat protein